MALGHRAMAKKFNDTHAPIVQPEPVSPEVNSISWEVWGGGKGNARGMASLHVGMSAPV